MYSKKKLFSSFIFVVCLIITTTACSKQNKLASSEKASQSNPTVASTAAGAQNEQSNLQSNSNTSASNNTTNSTNQDASNSTTTKVNSPSNSSISTSTNNSTATNTGSLPQSNNSQSTSTPTPAPAPAPKPTKQFIMIGDSMNDVISVMGKPSSSLDNRPESILWYNVSSDIIYLWDTGNGYKVIGWQNNDNLLKVSMGSKISSAPPITIGSSKDDVIRAIGTPDWNSPYFGYKNNDYPEWKYNNGNRIKFDRNYRVIGWDNEASLKVTLGHKDPSAPPIKIGSTLQDILNTLGTPKLVYNGGPTTAITEIHYTDCAIIFDMNGKAISIMNSGNPQVIN